MNVLRDGMMVMMTMMMMISVDKDYNACDELSVLAEVCALRVSALVLGIKVNH